MAEVWRQYETLMIFDPELGPEGTEALVQRSREFLLQESARILKTNRWGHRDLAYEMKGRRKGYYLLLEYAGPPRAITELERRLNLNDSVLKFQSILLKDSVDPAELPDTEEDLGDKPTAAAESAAESTPAAAATEEATPEPSATTDATAADEEPADATPDK